MNIKKITINFITFSICSLATIPFFNIACSKETPVVPIFIGNIEGTDWKGYESGSLTLDLGTTPDSDGVYTCSIKDKGDYEANDWVIPELVSDGENLYKVVGIENNAFAYCQNLTGTLTFPDSCTIVDEYAFNECHNITSVIFGNGLKTIGERSFFQCFKITSITWGNELQTIGDSSFFMCGLTGKLTIPNSVTTINNSAFNQCTNITSVEFGNGLKTIGKYVFYLCTGIASAVTIPDSVVSIADCCFQCCTNIPSISIGSGVQTIGEKVFQDCTGITQSDLDLSNVASIGAEAFEDDVSLIDDLIGLIGNLTISNNLKEVDSGIIINSNFGSITMKNFTNDFSYDSWKSDSFTHAKANGTVSVIGNGITTEQALAILKSKGLPSGWTVAQ